MKLKIFAVRPLPESACWPLFRPLSCRDRRRRWGHPASHLGFRGCFSHSLECESTEGWLTLILFTILSLASSTPPGTQEARDDQHMSNKWVNSGTVLRWQPREPVFQEDAPRTACGGPSALCGPCVNPRGIADCGTCVLGSGVRLPGFKFGICLLLSRNPEQVPRSL